MTRRFILELDRLKNLLEEMSGLVQERFEDVTAALFDGARERAQKVMDMDSEIDKYEITIDRTCEGIIALSQPVASDLRLIVSGLKMSTDLERMGDQAANIAGEIIASAPLDASLLKKLRLDVMADIVKEMVINAFSSFLNGDGPQAKQVCDRDDAVDDINLSIIQTLSDKNQSDLNHSQRVHLLIITQNLERIGDLATNIAEEVIFLVHAKIIKHHYQEFAG